MSQADAARVLRSRLSAVQSVGQSQEQERLGGNEDGEPRSGQLQQHFQLARSRTHRRQARVQPLAGAAGGAVRASVHRPGLRLQRLQPAADPAPRHHPVRARTIGSSPTRLDLHHRHRLPRSVRGRLRHLARAGRAAQGHVRRGLLLRRRLPGLGARRLVCISSGSSISATACSAASGSGSATSRRSRR